MAISAYAPTVLNRFVDGLSLFECNTVEDGRNWIDEIGFGMVNTEPLYIYGVVNERLVSKSKFRAIESKDKIELYRANPRQMIVDFENNE